MPLTQEMLDRTIPITQKMVEDRLAQLQADQQQVVTKIQQLQANLSAYAGAIEDCQYWLSQLKEEPQIKPAGDQAKEETS